MKPALLSFDVFGTVVDWRLGLRRDLARHGLALTDELFERVINTQARIERQGFQSYRTITAASLVEVLGLDPSSAEEIGRNLGRWPLFPDSRPALAALQELVPCLALTNSDVCHGEQVQEQLGFRLTDWLCAEVARLYKPRLEFWKLAAERRGIEPGSHWWHVSAYADYDLESCRQLGLTTVLVRRPHCRPAPAHYEVNDLLELLSIVAS